MNMEVNKILQGDCLEVLKTLPENSVDICILYGIYDILGLWKDFGTKLKKQILVGYGQAQIMGLAMEKFVSIIKKSTLIDYLMSWLREKSQMVFKLTTYAEFRLVAILAI